MQQNISNNPVQSRRRALFLGRRVDHVFVRGLDVTASRVDPVTSSDHNPLLVTFSIR